MDYVPDDTAHSHDFTPASSLLNFPSSSQSTPVALRIDEEHSSTAFSPSSETSGSDTSEKRNPVIDTTFGEYWYCFSKSAALSTAKVGRSQRISEQ